MLYSKYLLSLTITALIILTTSACITPSLPKGGLTATSIEPLIRSDVANPTPWAIAVEKGIRSSYKVPNAERACAVIAVIEQESGYKADPPVPNLPKVVRQALLDRLSILGPLKERALKAILSGSAPGEKTTFNERIKTLKTERDLDLFFRDLSAAYKDRFPGPFVIASALGRVFGKGWLQAYNPVTTAGSMQVSVDYAKTLRAFDDLEDHEVRDRLYTIDGGVLAGTVRLIEFEAGYKDLLYRFADYNAGFYTSRNAAFQKILTDLSGKPLALDGDLLAYNSDGDPSPNDSATLAAALSLGATLNLSERSIRRDFLEEKELDFEGTSTWQKVRQKWQERFGTVPEYALMPKVTLDSPKITGNKTTGWFAKNAKRRYWACRQRQQTLAYLNAKSRLNLVSSIASP